jgi:hypothetical protein
MPIYHGHLDKMLTELAAPVNYWLALDDTRVPLNALLGETLRIRHGGTIHCSHCGRVTKKSFSEGYCYPCFRKLAQCDLCILSPERCHFDAGTCREPDWAQSFCMTEHFVYLANSSGVKVGITRASQMPTRWIDQGAIQALPIARVQTRQQAGFVEAALRRHVRDTTDWRAMLKGNPEPADLAAARDRLFKLCADELSELTTRFGIQAIQSVEVAEPVAIDYPVREYPTRVTAWNLDKTPEVSGRLLGIKGQYLILDSGVFNVRKFSAYDIALEV